MLYFARWKVLAILLTCLAGVVIASPNFLSKETVAAWPTFLPKKQLPLGLDLQGGAHLLLAMDQEEIRKDWLNNLRDSARKTLRDAKLGFSGLGVQGGQLQVKLLKPEDREVALTELRKLIQPVGNAILGSSGQDIDVEPGTDPNTITLKPSNQGMKARVLNAAS